MSSANDIPHIPRRRWRGRRPSTSVGRTSLIVAIVALGLLVSAFRGIAHFYTDYLWFGSVDFRSVWSGILVTKISLAVGSVLFFFFVLWINVWVVDRFAPAFVPASQEDELSRHYQQFVRPRAFLLRTVGALVLAIFAGGGFYTRWQDWLLFLHGGKFGVTDPQFGKDVGFFVFKLPFLVAMVEWAFYALGFAIVVSLVVHYLQGGIRPQASTSRVSGAVKAHISVLLGLIALVWAVHYYLQRYRLSYSNRGVVTGASYTDVHFMLPALGLLILISILAAVLFFVGARARSWSLPTITVVLWLVVALLVGNVIPAAVQKLSVEPAESQKESPYIKRNIDQTRQALGLDRVKVTPFPYKDDLAAADLDANAQTIRNVRLWDPADLRPVYKRLQEVRPYFQFVDIDIDRYALNDETTQMMLSVRELNPSGLPSDRRSWVNQHLAYTHGYGAVASPANAVSSDGAAEFTLKDLPPVGTPSVTRPQVYFGESTNNYSIVNTRQGEVDYPAVDGRDQTSKYDGSGGVKLDSFLTRAAFAARVGDINPLISGLVDDQSRAMYITDIRERVMKVAPFLQFDNDPYPIISNGRIMWMQDAYTTTNSYPYGESADTSLVARNRQGAALNNVAFNYVRNSVKIVTDAYDGTMKFYVNDPTDPIIKAWQKAFPKLFVDASTLPQDLRSHIRYPEDLFRTQSTMFGSYHLTNAQDFYSKSDRWNIAQKPEFGNTTTAVPVATAPGTAPAGEQRIEPYYLLMKLPGESDVSFLMFQPFVPFSQGDTRKELSAFMTAKSDPDHYGDMSAFVMPRDRQVDGPALVEARIQQDPTISQYITLLDRSGSKVDLGNMLIIPIDNSLLYIRPLYVESRQTNVPEFKKAIVVQGSKVVMADTLQKALAQMFGSAPETLEKNQSQPTPSPAAQEPSGVPATTAPAAPAPADNLDQVRALLDQANNEFGQADQALRNGDLAEYQRHVQAGVDLVKKARGG